MLLRKHFFSEIIKCQLGLYPGGFVIRLNRRSKRNIAVGMSFTPIFTGLFCSQHNVAGLKRFISCGKHFSAAVSQSVINEKTFKIDSYTNITQTIISRLNRKLYKVSHHPISLLKDRIVQYFHNNFTNKRGNPLFSLYDDLSPIVTTQQNFDSLLIPQNHPSRAKSDCYYINQECMLRSHMTAHQADLLRMGLNSFLMLGDVYRRDAIDSSHYPVFHQLDGVRLFTPEELFAEIDNGMLHLTVKEKDNQVRTADKQEVYTSSAVRRVEAELKRTLEGLSRDLFGGDVKYRWCEAEFPFTHPSWELEIWLDGKWIEVLGCGVVEHKILERAGCLDRIGWAFGLGLDRLAMIYYSIPDIRVFWSHDPAFLRQFKDKTWADRIAFKQISAFPPCHFDLSFWLGERFDPEAFEQAVSDHCGEALEHLELIDSYVDPKGGRESRCYRLYYRSMVKTFTKKELAETHKSLERMLAERFKIEVR